MRTLLITHAWQKVKTPIKHLDLPKDMIIGLIRRPLSDGTHEIIFPHGNDLILPKDEVTCIGESDTIANIHDTFLTPHPVMRSIVILGGSQIALNLAKLLRDHPVAIRIIEKEADRCAFLADQLPHCTIICQDVSSLDFLQSEKIDMADLVLVCTPQDELNMMVCLLAKQAGSKSVAVVLSKAEYHPIAEKLGVSYAVSPRLVTANRLLSIVLSSQVTRCVSLYENKAEVVEIKISLNSKITGIPINQLGPLFPKDFLIAVIQNRGRIIIANGTRILSPGDNVIVVTAPKHMNELERLF
jgi:trk system potassium uptake protein TrkA